MTGGQRFPTYHSSTEQLVKGGGSWTITENSLPARMFALSSITLDNQIFTTGNHYFEQNIIHTVVEKVLGKSILVDFQNQGQI